MVAFRALNDGSFPRTFPRIFDRHDPQMISWLVEARVKEAAPLF